MTAMYRRADDNRWWPVRGRNRRLMPHNTVIEVKLTDGSTHSHAGLTGDGKLWGICSYPAGMNRVAGWRYPLPPTFKFPGDATDSWVCPDELYDAGPEVETL